MDDAEIEALKAENESLKAEKDKSDTRIKQAEHVIETLKKAPKVEKIEEPKADAEELKAKLKTEVVSELRDSLLSDALEDSLKAVAPDPEEREMVAKEYRESIVKSGLTKASIEADVKKAATLVRSQKNETKAEELARAVGAQKGSGGGAGSNQDKPKTTEDWKRYLSSTDLAYMTQAKWPEERMRKAALAIKAERGI